MPPFLRRGKRTAAFDIGSGYLKVVVIDHAGAQPELVHAAYSPQVSDAIVDGEVMDPQLVVETLRSLVENGEVGARTTVTSVGGRDVMVKKIQTDRTTEAEARELMRWEAQNHVPFDMDDVQVDFQILDPDGDGLQMEVLLVAVKRDLVTQKISLLQDVGIVPTVVDVDAFAIHNAFEYNYPELLDRTVALVNVGHELSTINVVQGGAPVLTRDVPLGTRRLRDDLRRSEGLSAEEAEAVVQGAPDHAGELAPRIRELADELAEGVERAVSFSSMGGVAPDLDRILLCGGGACIPGLADGIAERIGVLTEVASPFNRLRVQPEVSAHFPVEELAPMLMLSIGLALRPAA